MDYGAGGQMEPRPDGGYGLREGYYDDNGQYHAVPSAPHAPGYDPGNFVSGSRPGSGSAYYDPAGGSGEQWHGGQVGAAATPQASLGYDDEGDEDEDDYYDDDHGRRDAALQLENARSGCGYGRGCDRWWCRAL